MTKLKLNNMYGVFIYYKDNDEYVTGEYYPTVKLAIKRAKEMFKQFDIGEKKDLYIQVWKRDDEGLYGNTGRQIFELNN